MMTLRTPIITLTLIILSGCASQLAVENKSIYRDLNRPARKIYRHAENYLKIGIAGDLAIPLSDRTAIENIVVNRKTKTIEVYFNKYFSFAPLRKVQVVQLNQQFREELGWRYRKYQVTLFSLGEPIDALIPNFYRDPQEIDTARLPNEMSLKPLPLVTVLNRPVQPDLGLMNHTVALWASHGWYYDNEGKHWSWQRPRLFQTVEDIFPLSFTLHYIIPMLENSGAYVFTPRERDIQVNEVIVDNDTPDLNGEYRETSNNWQTASDSGFAVGNPPYTTGVNPFKLGTYRTVVRGEKPAAKIQWIPVIPENGRYSVQVAYHSLENSTTAAHYIVFHKGGKSEFRVNQQIGGGTWIYLGEFEFAAGKDPESCQIVLSDDETNPGQLITADGVRFGGGRGNIARAGQISRRARYLEGARYYLQYAGIHDTLVYNLNADSLDYTDDYQSRGEWVNYLKGAPYGPNRNRAAAGLGVPVDVSLAFHTDAGIKPNSSVGTLSIYSYEDSDSNLVFPDGMSRLANRDLADIMQTQIVQDIRAKYDPDWNRRALMNAGYSEAYRPNVPAVLVELLSHQNFYDMRYGNDPRFQFDVGRSMYKAILKFIATQYQRGYVVQPLPVDHFYLNLTDNNIRLNWQTVKDTLEPTAVPDGYIVYTRAGDGEFDGGTYIGPATHWVHENVQPGVIYSYRITAVNRGGESFPSEVLAACYLPDDSMPVLIVNGFDRVSAPVTIETTCQTGFTADQDNGVADIYTFSYTGKQIDFNRSAPFISNIAPGHGASLSDNETRIIPGNTHDYTSIHGRAFSTNGHSFVSSSDETVESGQVRMTDYTIVDLIMGEEREVLWPSEKANKWYGTQFKCLPAVLQDSITGFLAQGGKILISGAYVGTDLAADPGDKKFTAAVLKYEILKDQAATTGGVFSADTAFAPNEFDFQFNTGQSSAVYAVESPDALQATNDSSKILLRYEENHYGAAVGYKGGYSSIVCGFPLETIPDSEKRTELFKYFLRYLLKQTAADSPTEADRKEKASNSKY